MLERRLVIAAGVLGLTAVALGAFGAHGLRSMVQALPDGAERLSWWQTAAHYHLIHALAVALAAWLASRGPTRAAAVAGACLVAGVVIFSGTLYAMALGGPRWLGAVTPLGGLSMMAGWVAVVVAGVRLARRDGDAR